MGHAYSFVVPTIQLLSYCMISVVAVGWMLPRSVTSALGRQIAFAHGAHCLSHQQAVIAGLNASNHSDYISVLYIYNMQKWYILVQIWSQLPLVFPYCYCL